MCHDPPSFADGRTFTDSSWSVRQVGVQKIDEKEAALLDVGCMAETQYS